jgi:autotransporter passenger strand-loop-strand repeat protein
MTVSTVSSGVTVSGVDITSGNLLEVSPGGRAVGTIVESGGEAFVESGGVASGTTGGFAMRVAPLFCVALLLAGCLTAHQPADPYSAGYSETRLAADSFQVFAQAGSVERAGQMLELRAAQLTLDNGYRKFVVFDRSVTTERRSNDVSGYSSGAPGSPQTRVASRMETVTIAKGKMTIRMLQGSDSTGKAVDASAILERFHPQLIGVAGG